MAKTTLKERLTQKELKEGYGKIHDRIIDISEETVDVTVENIEKWQKLFAQTLTKSTPLVEKGIDISFDVAETIFKQYKTGGERVKSLLGLGNNPIKKVKLNIPTKSAPASPTTPKTKNVKAAKGQRLTDIKGIGPKIEGLLVKKGVNSLDALAKAYISLLEEILVQAGPRFQMHDPKTWINQAKEMLK